MLSISIDRHEERAFMVAGNIFFQVLRKNRVRLHSYLTRTFHAGEQSSSHDMHLRDNFIELNMFRGLSKHREDEEQNSWFLPGMEIPLSRLISNHVTHRATSQLMGGCCTFVYTSLMRYGILEMEQQDNGSTYQQMETWLRQQLDMSDSDSASNVSSTQLLNRLIRKCLMGFRNRIAAKALISEFLECHNIRCHFQTSSCYNNNSSMSYWVTMKRNSMERSPFSECNSCSPSFIVVFTSTSTGPVHEVV